MQSAAAASCSEALLSAAPSLAGGASSMTAKRTKLLRAFEAARIDQDSLGPSSGKEEGHTLFLM